MEKDFLNDNSEYKTEVYDEGELPDEFKYPDFGNMDLLNQEITYSTVRDDGDSGTSRKLFMILDLQDTSEKGKSRIRWFVRILLSANFVVFHLVKFTKKRDFGKINCFFCFRFSSTVSKTISIVGSIESS